MVVIVQKRDNLDQKVRMIGFKDALDSSAEIIEVKLRRDFLFLV